MKKQNTIAIVTMCFIFAMISFVTNMAAPFGTIWQGQYNWAGMMGNMMNFLAYLIMGIPAGKMLLKIGYKRTALIALATGFAGMVLQWLSSVCGADIALGSLMNLNYLIYLLGAFVCGFCVCMLNTVVNPMLNTLGGGGNKGNQLIQVGGTLNSLTGALTPLFVGILVGAIKEDTSMANVQPLLFIAMGVFAVAFVIISLVKIPEPTLGKRKEKYEHSAWSFRHTVLGIIAIFFYVGIEVGIPGEMLLWFGDKDPNTNAGVLNGVAVGGAIAAVYWLLMMVGRAASSAISGKISTRTQLITVSSTAIVLILCAIFIPKDITMSMPSYNTDRGLEIDGVLQPVGFMMVPGVPVKVLFLVLCGLCTSLMWGGIFNLSVEGIGKYTEQASGLFMMMVVGGGVMPLLQNLLAKKVGYMPSYWLVVVMLCYLLFYAVWGCRNVNKDIPVE